MKTFGFTFLFIYGLFLIWWLFLILFTKPTFNNGGNRIAKNWNEGGNIVLLVGTILSLVLSIGIAKIILVFNFLEG